MLRRIIFAGSLFFSLNACATKVDGLQVSDSFTANGIKSGAIVSGGVVSKEGLSRADSNAYAGVLLSKIKDEREYLGPSVLPVETLINAVGEDNYSSLLAKYSQGGLDAAELTELSSKLPKARFVALAKIERDVTEKDTQETHASESKDKDGKVTKVEGSIRQIHSRTVDSTLTVYDLKEKNIAFSGQVSKTAKAEKSYPTDGIRGVMSMVNTIKGEAQDSVYPYPEAPDTRRVLADVFEGFAENFPKE